MKCAYCKEDIQDGALICRYCGKKQTGTKARVKTSYIVVGAAVVLLIILIMVDSGDRAARAQLSSCGVSEAGLTSSQVAAAADLCKAAGRP